MTGANTPDLRALVERLEAALSQAANTPGFGADMVVWSELAGSVQQAMEALTTLQHRIAEMEAALGVWLAIDEKLTGGDAVGQIEWQQASTQSRSTLKDRGEGR